MTKEKKEELSTYEVALRSLGGAKWLAKATPDQIAKLDALKEPDQIAALTKVTKDYGRQQAKS